LALLPGRSSRQAGSLRCACSGHPESGRTRFRDAAIVPDPVSILSDMRLNVRRSLSQRWTNLARRGVLGRRGKKGKRSGRAV